MPPTQRPNFRDQARASLDRENFDEAIRLFLAAIRQNLDDVSLHREIREASFLRKAAGGKSLSLIDRLRIGLARNPQRRLLEATKMLAHDPGDMDVMATILKAANEAGFHEVANWIGRIIQAANEDARHG